MEQEMTEASTVQDCPRREASTPQECPRAGTQASTQANTPQECPHTGATTSTGLCPFFKLTEKLGAMTPAMTPAKTPAKEKDMRKGQGWEPEEERVRQKHLKSMEVSEEAIRASPASFGKFFLDQLVSLESGPLQYVWSHKPVGQASYVLGEVALEVIRLVHLPSRSAIRSAVKKVALRHVDHNVDQSFNKAFGSCFVQGVEKFATVGSIPWHRRCKEAWQWCYSVVAEAFFAEVQVLSPQIHAVRKSWRSLLAKQSLKGTVSTTSTLAMTPPARRSRTIKVGGVEGAEAEKDSKEVGVTRVGLKFVSEFEVSLRAAGLDTSFPPGHAGKIGPALDTIVTLATDPQALDTYVWRLAKMHVGAQRGSITERHMGCFQAALFNLLQGSLSESLFEEAQPGWEWLWKEVNASFSSVLHRWRNMQEQVEASWGLVLGKVGGREPVARAFYNKLFEVHPSLQDLFERPIDAQSKMFADTLQIVVDSARHTSKLQGELEQLAVLHHKFNLKPWHFECVGGVLLDLLKAVCGDGFTDAVRDAWAELYRGVSATFLEILDGRNRNAMAAAIMRQSLEGVFSALSAAPRGKRASCALTVPMGGSARLSPVLWAVRDGFHDIAQLLIADLGVVRADRSGHYHGIHDAWSSCPELLETLVTFAPQLLEPFFDGHMLVGQECMEGFRQVHLWVSYVYGDPSVITNVYDSPLGVLVDKLPEAYLSVFHHPVVVATVSVKWHRFGRALTLMIIMMQTGCLTARLAMRYGQDSRNPALTVFGVMVWICLCFVMTLLSVYLILHQVMHHRMDFFFLPGTSFVMHMPRCLFDGFIWLRMSCCVPSLIMCVHWITRCRMDFHHHDLCFELSSGAHWLMAIITWLQWIQVTEIFMLSEALECVIHIGWAMIKDGMRFMTVLVLWLIAMSAALHHLVRLDCAAESGMEGCEGDAGALAEPLSFAPTYIVFASMLGYAGSGIVYYEGGHAGLVQFCFTVGVWVFIVPLLNLVISAMVSTYSRLEPHMENVAVRARANMLVQMEDLMDPEKRLRHFEALHFNDPLELGREEFGLPGGISRLRSHKELEGNPAYGRRLEMLRFGGAAEPTLPWPAHTVPGSPADLRHSETDGRVQAEFDRVHAAIAELRVAQRSGAESHGNGPLRASAEIPLSGLADLQAALGKDAIVLAVEGHVYEVSGFAKKHPGGLGPLQRYAGSDATQRFRQHQDLPRARSELARLPRLGNLKDDGLKDDTPADSSFTAV